MCKVNSVLPKSNHAMGAMAHLNDLYLNNNPVSDKTKGTMRTAMSKRSGQVHF